MKAPGNDGALLLHGHGVEVVGNSIPTVVGRAIELELNGRLLRNILAMGCKPLPLLPDQRGGGLRPRLGRLDQGRSTTREAGPERDGRSVVSGERASRRSRPRTSRTPSTAPLGTPRTETWCASR